MRFLEAVLSGATAGTPWAAHTVRSSLACTETTSQSDEQYVEGVSSRSEESALVLSREASEQ